MNDAEKLRWLMDRAEITDLLVRVAQSADDKDYRSLAECFAPEGVIVTFYRDIGRDEIAAAIEEILSPFEATHHFIGRFAITIDGDRATARHMVISTHVPRLAEPGRHADIGGTYATSFRRMNGEWRLTSLDMRAVFSGGIPFVPGGAAA